MDKSNVKVHFSDAYSERRDFLQKKVEEIIKYYYKINFIEVFVGGNVCNVNTFSWLSPWFMNKTMCEIRFDSELLIVTIRKENLSPLNVEAMCMEFGEAFGKDEVRVYYSTFPPPDYY